MTSEIEIQIQWVSISDDGEYCLGCGEMTSDYARIRELGGDPIREHWHASWICPKCRASAEMCPKLIGYLGKHSLSAREYGEDQRWKQAVRRSSRLEQEG